MALICPTKSLFGMVNKISSLSLTTHEFGENYKAKHFKVSHIVVDDQLRGSQSLEEEW